MSALSSQCDELRLMARLVRDYDYKEISRMLREAANTIESLRDRLQAVGPLDVLLRCLENDYGIRASWDGLRRVWVTESVTAELDCIEDKSRYSELFGTPERAARTLHSGGTLICRECLIREECEKTPEDSNCMITDYDALLEWLRGGRMMTRNPNGCTRKEGDAE